MKNNQSHKKEKGLILPSEFLSPNINNDNKILEKAKGLEKKLMSLEKYFKKKMGNGC